MATGEEQSSLIVVVDDSDLVRNILERTLRSAGYSVIVREDANSGFEVIRRELPDLVLTDIGLGVTSGLDLITRIRSDLPAAQQPVIIACSGFGEFEQQALARGADSFLPKPFDLPTMLAVVAEVLAGQPRSAPLSARASLRARALRRDAIVAAKAALARWKQRRPDYEHVGMWAVTWLPRYLGFGGALVALIEGEHLRVFASSDPRFAKGDVLDQASFFRDVVETSSNLVLPDAILWSQTGIESARFFAGVPVTDGEVAIGTIALVDDEPHHFMGEDLALLEALGRRGSDALSALGEQTLAFWTPSGLLSRAGLRMLLTLEIKRSEHTMTSLFLLVFEATDTSWRGEVETALGAERTTLAELGGDRFAVSLVRETSAGVVHELDEVIQSVRFRGVFRGGGLVSLTGGNVAMRSGDELIWLAEELCARALRLGGDRIESVLVRHEPWPIELAPLP